MRVCGARNRGSDPRDGGAPVSDLADELREALRPLVADLVRAELAEIEAAPPSPYLTVEEAADYLRAKPQRVYDLLSDGRLTRVKDGSRALVARAEIDAYLALRPARRSL